MSTNYPIGAEIAPNAPYNEEDKVNECMYCGEETDNKYYCSKPCMKADFND